MTPEQLLNKMITNQLSTINAAIQTAIRTGGMDPWGTITTGGTCLGSINLGICNASANVSYSVNNMRGLGSFRIDAIQLSGTQTDPANPSVLVGSVSVNASLKDNISANVGGEFDAKCGFIHPSVGVSGDVRTSGTQGTAAGTFSASVQNNQVCLTSVSLGSLYISVGGINVHIGSLGIFSSFADPLANLITNKLNGNIANAVSNVVKPILSRQISGVLPLCQSLV
jgi:hypothetical protein